MCLVCLTAYSHVDCAEEYNIDGMSAEVAYFSQDYWLTSLAIGHPLAFQSQASSENKLGDAPELDDASVRNFVVYQRETNGVTTLILILDHAMEYNGYG